MIIHELTWKQYQKAAIDLACKEYPDATRAEVSECYMETNVRLTHFQACFKACQDGIILKRAVLDCLSDNWRYRIFHDIPDYLNLWRKSTGKPYINPEARKVDKWGKPL